MATVKMQFSAPAYDRILKVARTIAGMADSADVRTDYVSEATQFGSLDRQRWA